MNFDLAAILNNPVSVAAVASFFTSLLKPYVERLPFARTTSDLHDGTIIILNGLINYLILLAQPATTGKLTGPVALQLLVQAGLQMALGNVGYKTLTKLGGSVGKTAGSDAAPAQTVALGVSTGTTSNSAPAARVGPLLVAPASTRPAQPLATARPAPEETDNPQVPAELAGTLAAESGL